MKVGILTFHDADNCGAVLQAYALQEAVKLLKTNVEIVNYVQPYIIESHKVVRINFNGMGRLIRSIGSTLLHFKDLSSKKKEFNRFRKEYLNISKEKFNCSRDIQGYSTYIVGSDQIWNSEITNFDDTFFLKFCNESNKKIAYAASIGRDKISDDEKQFIKKHVNNLEYISVRENSAIEILNNLTEKRVHRVLDPTLLVDKKLWDKFITKEHKKDYILVYTVGPSESLMAVANKISKKLGLEILQITDSRRMSKYKCKRLRGVGPVRFINLIQSAAFIVTNSFHGTAFSVIFNKDFVTVPHDTGGTRMVSLLHLLKLDDRIVNNANELNSDFKFKIDYTIADEILKNEQQKSFDFLKNAIEN